MHVDTSVEFDKAFRGTFNDKRIDNRCKPGLVLDYADNGAINTWLVVRVARTYRHEELVVFSCTGFERTNHVSKSHSG